MKTRWIARGYAALCRVSPGFRKSTRRLMYRLMARHAPSSGWTFMNYGYEPMEDEAAGPPLDLVDEPDRTFIQLYHHVVRGIDLRGRDVLEVGSGRGGGAAYVKQYYQPRRMVGLDFSNEAVSFCRAHHCADGLHFVTGDAENLPFGDASFDAAINVESAHCYGSMGAFLGQVWRVLRPGGAFMYADFCSHDRLGDLDGQIARSGLKVAHRTDITPNVLRGLIQSRERRIALIRQAAHPIWLRAGQEFAGLEGSNIYHRFQLGTMVYQSFMLIKS